MAIGNVTPDSFYASSRLPDEASVIAWAHHALANGANILDIGACSTRPNSTPVDEETEWLRLEPALSALRKELPEASLSLDTFRPEIARRALESFGPMIINDVSGGCEQMFELVRKWGVSYVWTSRDNLKTTTRQLRDNYESTTSQLREINWILDPGFGFHGGVEQDYEYLRNLDLLREFNRPILVGISRKSMIYKPLGLTPETCLAATQALQLYALEHGASILRTHDVRETAQTIALWEQIANQKC